MPLDNNDKEEALAFLLQSPESNVVPLFNITHFGMDPGKTPFHGYYFGNRTGSVPAALGVVLNLGSVFFHAVSPEAVSGMAEHIIAAGKSPLFVEGPKPQVERLLAELGGKYDATPRPLTCRRLLLKGEVNPGIDTSGVRPSRLEEIDILVRLGQAMHREMFGAEGMDEPSFHALLRLQIESGCAFLREEDGEIVSKVEGTAVPPHAALIGGVYTVPDSRGREHATACVSALCAHLLQEVEVVALTAEPGNPSAYSVYMRTGFTGSADWMAVSFQ